MDPGWTQDGPRTHPGWTQEFVLRVLYAPSADRAAGSEERGAGGHGRKRSHRAQNCRIFVLFAIFRGGPFLCAMFDVAHFPVSHFPVVVLHLSSFIPLLPSPGTARSVVGRGSGRGLFPRLYPNCKQMSTTLSYSSRGFRRNPLRHNGLRTGKLFAPLAADFAPHLGTVAVTPCRIRSWEFQVAAREMSKNSVRRKKPLLNSFLAGIVQSSAPSSISLPNGDLSMRIQPKRRYGS